MTDNFQFPDFHFPDWHWPEWHWPELEEELSVMCQDTVTILQEWQETLTVKRMSVTYSDSKTATETWAEVDSFLGDWQPAIGDTMRKEAGLIIKSSSLIIAPCNVDVQANDLITREDGTVFYVNYVKDYEDHQTIYLKQTEGSN